MRRVAEKIISRMRDHSSAEQSTFGRSHEIAHAELFTVYEDGLIETAEQVLYEAQSTAPPDLSLLYETVREVHEQIADDICWMDIDKIFKAAGLPVPDRRVGDKTEMLINCAKFIETMCQGGKWISYKQLKEENETLKKELEMARIARRPHRD